MESLGTLERTDEGITVEFTLVIPTSPAEVWKAITDPSVISRWLAHAEFDASPGGRVHLKWNEEDEMHGEVIEFSPPQHLSYSWIETDGTSKLSFDLHAVDGDTTHLTLSHSRTTEENAPGFGAGWHAHLEGLVLVLTGGDSSAEVRDARYRELRPEYDALLQGE
jgi:uncharacterized protein YndB with AHSA1/START domain